MKINQNITELKLTINIIFLLIFFEFSFDIICSIWNMSLDKI